MGGGTNAYINNRNKEGPVGIEIVITDNNEGLVHIERSTRTRIRGGTNSHLKIRLRWD